MMKKTRFVRKTPRLGQHFLNNPTVARSLVEACEIRHDETVLEIGPGTGALTRELLATGGHVLAIEKDPTLVSALRNIFQKEIDVGQLTIREEDIRDFSPERAGLKTGQYVLAANIPYYITGEIIRMFLTAMEQPRIMALLMQKEVADRIVARDGKESILSISVKAYGTPRVVRKVSAGNFTPPPSVDSAILSIENISRNFFYTLDEYAFFTFVRAGFSSRRKKLLSNLGRVCNKDVVREAFAHVGLHEDMRAEELSLASWKKLATALSSSA